MRELTADLFTLDGYAAGNNVRTRSIHTWPVKRFGAPSSWPSWIESASEPSALPQPAYLDGQSGRLNPRPVHV